MHRAARRARPTTTSRPSPWPAWSCRPTCVVQAPPNLADDFGGLLDAGIDDWGGVSPVTADHVNPERPWPALDRLPRGHRGPRLRPRPPPHRLPARAWPTPSAWLDAGAALPGDGPQRRRGPGPRRPRRGVPRGKLENAKAGTGAEVVLTGVRSTAWYSGADATRPRSCPPRPAAPGRAGAGRPRSSTACAPASRSATTRSSRCSPPGAPRSPPSPRWPTTCAARPSATRSPGSRNRNINYTNVCTFKCRFCGFSKGPLSLNLRGTPYLLTLDDIAERVARGVGDGRHRGLPAGRHPPQLRRRLLHRRHPGREGRGARHARPRLHRPRGHRGGEAPRRAAGRLPPPPHGRRAAHPARHRGGDPRRRRSAAILCPDKITPTSGSTPTAPPTRSACGRTSRSCSARSSRPTRGPATSSAPATCRPRPAGSPSSSACRSCTWPRRSTSSARPGGARRSARCCSCTPWPASPTGGSSTTSRLSWVKLGPVAGRQLLQAGVQRPRRHADGREHLAGGRAPATAR